MEFALTDEQIQMQESVERFLAETSNLEYVRKTTNEGAVHDKGLWQGIAEMGMTALLVPEDFGGMGMTVLDAALIQEQLGYRTAPVGYIPNAVLAPIAITEGGSDEQKAKWLPALAEGSLNVAVGINESASGSRDGAGIKAEGGKLFGRSLFVLGSQDADLFIFSTTNGELYAVEAGAEGLDLSELNTVDTTQAVFEANLNDVTAEALNARDDLLAELIDIARIMFAADSLGASQNMLDQAVAYSHERVQFGRAIGTFQAVKHMCAEMAGEIEPSRSLMWYAAYSCSDVPEDRSLMACHVKAHISEISRFVARTATEAHGGMGFTDELGLHYWFKRIGFNRQILGGPEKTREQAARLQNWIA
ncbi:acyl-CoA dehydrogenase family protein [Maricurvus nonylphenolicus]|uniref:acyl-CoA dehydrogenase family protein n=1 Tax=Maricurvus nonylphenolicus TaxID=1008307 RepID=UPI0036F1E39D